jgi:hypothetical protein
MKYLVGIFALSAMLLLTACASFEDRAANVQQRLSVLEQKGLPDSVISPIRLSFATAQGAKQRNRGSEANKSMRAALEATKHAEVFLEKALTEKKPEVVARHSALSEKSANDLRGLHKRDADSLLERAKGFLDDDLVFRADNIISQLERDYPRMLRDQAIADSIRPRVQGTWVFTDTAKHTEDRSVNAVERKTFTLNRNGTARFVAEKRGQSAPALREEWRNETSGTWDLRGNVVHLIAERFVQHRQTVWQLNHQTGRWGHIDPGTSQFVEGRPRIIPAETLERDHPDISRQNLFIPFRDLEAEYRRR